MNQYRTQIARRARDNCRVVSDLETPSRAQRDEAIRLWGERAAHDRFMRSWPCINTLERALPPHQDAATGKLKVAAWNMERCKHVEASTALIEASGADIVLATEMDLGMARSGQRHTTREIAQALGFGYVYGVEYVELSAGDPYETAAFAGVHNDHGLHGNAILSRLPLLNPAIVALDDAAMWYVSAPKEGAERRVGTRMAITAQVDTGKGMLSLASVHLESETDAAGRAAQTALLLDTLDALYGGGPTLVGGDFNTHTLHSAPPEEILVRGSDTEPCFQVCANRGYSWQHANVGAITHRHYPGRPVLWQSAALDWLFTRGLTANDPSIIPAVAANGTVISDHDMVMARINL